MDRGDCLHVHGLAVACYLVFLGVLVTFLGLGSNGLVIEARWLTFVTWILLLTILTVLRFSRQIFIWSPLSTTPSLYMSCQYFFGEHMNFHINWLFHNFNCCGLIITTWGFIGENLCFSWSIVFHCDLFIDLYAKSGHLSCDEWVSEFGCFVYLYYSNKESWIGESFLPLLDLYISSRRSIVGKPLFAKFCT